MMLGALALISPSVVSAEQVALTFDEQGFTIVGELQGLTEVGYVLTTETGEYTIPFSYVSCEGEACPEIGASVPAES